MNNRQSNRRRGRGNNRSHNNRGGGFDHQNTIDNRSRGNANQMLEKYKKQANDAQLNGDRVNAEYYLQFADHYFRVLADFRARQEAKQEARELRNEEQNSKADRSDSHNDHNNANNSSSNSVDTNVAHNSNEDDKDQVVTAAEAENVSDKPRRGKRTSNTEAQSEDTPKKPTARKKPASRAKPAPHKKSDSKNDAADGIDIAVLPPSLALEEGVEEKPKKRVVRKRATKKVIEENNEDQAATE